MWRGAWRLVQCRSTRRVFGTALALAALAALAVQLSLYHHPPFQRPYRHSRPYPNRPTSSFAAQSFFCLLPFFNMVSTRSSADAQRVWERRRDIERRVQHSFRLQA